MGIIRQRKSTHDILNKTNFQQFKEEMLAFCQSFCKFTVPFLHKVCIAQVKHRIDAHCPEKYNYIIKKDHDG